MNDSLRSHWTRVLAVLVLALALGVSSCGEVVSPGNVVDDYPFFPCGPAHEQPGLEFQSLHWTADGTHLIFDFATSGIWTVDAEGTQIRKIVDANPHEFYFMFGFHADVSPDGNQIVYSSCEFRTERGIQSYSERRDYNYEIAVISQDGTGQQRLTTNHHLDHHPVWSPDGSRIAFLASPKNTIPVVARHVELYTMAADGSDVRLVASTLRKVIREGIEVWHTPAELSFEKVQQGEEPEDSEEAWIGDVVLLPPVWSPDGLRLAFLVARIIPMDEEGTSGYRSAATLVTARADGTEFARIANIASIPSMIPNEAFRVPILPSWSPDGQYLVFVMANEEDDPDGVYTARFDGAEMRQILDEYATYVSWSPDGSEILLLAGRQYFVVQPDGSDFHSLELSGLSDGWQYAVWSPDSTRIAIYITGTYYTRNESSVPQLFTVARDGTDRRDLIRLDADGNLVPANPPQQTE